jgi:hypothetical protein
VATPAGSVKLPVLGGLPTALTYAKCNPEPVRRPAGTAVMAAALALPVVAFLAAALAAHT